jgi:hypothetical protein
MTQPSHIRILQSISIYASETCAVCSRPTYIRPIYIIQIRAVGIGLCVQFYSVRMQFAYTHAQATKYIGDQSTCCRYN